MMKPVVTFGSFIRRMVRCVIDGKLKRAGHSGFQCGLRARRLGNGNGCLLFYSARRPVRLLAQSGPHQETQAAEQAVIGMLSKESLNLHSIRFSSVVLAAVLLICSSPMPLVCV